MHGTSVRDYEPMKTHYYISPDEDHDDDPEKRQRVSVEGNIGSGKSTLLGQLMQLLTFQCMVIPEPVQQWEAIKDEKTGKNILQSFYEDKKKWSFLFQLAALHSRADLLKANWHYPYILYERSVVCDKEVFARMLFEDGFIEPMEMQIYNKMWDTFARQTMGVAPTKMIYVRTPPEVCAQRISQRLRPGEEGIPMEYLTRLHSRHEEIFGRDTLAIPTLVIDGTQDWKNDEAVFSKIAKDINKFVFSS